MDREWSAMITRVERMRCASGAQMEGEWIASEAWVARVESEWSTNGARVKCVRVDREWNANGVQVKRRVECKRSASRMRVDLEFQMRCESETEVRVDLRTGGCESSECVKLNRQNITELHPICGVNF